jgi:CBS domain containing-hemolysin-like protein
VEVVAWEIAGIVVCLLGSAFFSSSETALTSLSNPEAQKLYEGGARSLKLWLDSPLEVLTTILIGNNIFNITASALATDASERLLTGTAAAGWAIPAAVGVMTLALLTFGEITPKAWAQRSYKKIASPIMVLMRVPYALFTPLTRGFSGFTRRLMVMMGQDPGEQIPFVTAEEIEYMIDLGSREGTFSEDRERMLRSVFEFNDTLVREAMVPRTDMVALSVEMGFEEVVVTLRECGHSRIPVYRDAIDDIVGVFYVKDLIPLMLTPGATQSFSLEDVMREPFFVPDSKRIRDLLTEFQRQRMHIAIVIDEFGGTDGLITLEDIIEEFFGEIQDEYDVEEESIVAMGEDRMSADGRVSLDEVGGYFGVDLEDDEDEGAYDTLGGFLMARAGSVPSKGDAFVWSGLRFTVTKADAKRVRQVEVVRLSAPAGEVSA